MHGKLEGLVKFFDDRGAGQLAVVGGSEHRDYRAERLERERTVVTTSGRLLIADFAVDGGRLNRDGLRSCAETVCKYKLPMQRVLF